MEFTARTHRVPWDMQLRTAASGCAIETWKGYSLCCGWATGLRFGERDKQVAQVFGGSADDTTVAAAPAMKQDGGQ